MTMRRRSGGRAFPHGRVPGIGVVAAMLVALVVRPADGAEAPPSAQDTWSACAIGSAAVTVVSSYPRAGVPHLAAGPSGLHCGTQRYGLRHIVIRHLVDWQDAASDAGSEDWAQFTHEVLTQVLGAPASVHCDDRRNTCAFGRDSLADAGTAVVVVARQDGKVITAYPKD